MCGITNHTIGYVHTRTPLAASNCKLLNNYYIELCQLHQIIKDAQYRTILLDSQTNSLSIFVYAAFKKQTRPLVVGSIDNAIFGTADLFIAEGTVSVKDDCGLQVEEADFTDDFYGSLIWMYDKCISDWVIKPHLQSGMIIVCGIRELWYQHFVCS